MPYGGKNFIMLVTLLIGYASASFLGVTGYLMLGGTAWLWGLFVWIGGAISSLLVAGIRLYLRPTNNLTLGAPALAKSMILECSANERRR